jgi:recombination DNA repair RAD52 pathway protein
MIFNEKQTDQLLKPIVAARVLRDGKGNSHVSQQDITAHLIRVFGFGGFDTHVLSVECVFERPTVKISKGKQAPDPNRYDVCYRALVRLDVKNDVGEVVATYEDGSTATAENQTLGDAHDLAYKSAISLSKKRCAINLGDQFGLSLYNKGQMSALVKGTIVHDEPPQGDLQEGVERQVALGNDEIDRNDPEDHGPDPAETEQQAGRFRELIDAATTATELNAIAADIAASSIAGVARDELRRYFSAKTKAVAA